MPYTAGSGVTAIDRGRLGTAKKQFAANRPGDGVNPAVRSGRHGSRRGQVIFRKGDPGAVQGVARELAGRWGPAYQGGRSGTERRLALGRRSVRFRPPARPRPGTVPL